MEDKDTIITIDSISLKGHGQGFSLDNPLKIVEVAHTAIGDTAKILLNRRKRKGRLLEVLKPSVDRCEPKCSHASLCGGCTLQQVKYEKQLQVKEFFIQKAFSELLFSQNTELYSIMPCEFPWQYRNKMEFSFSQNKANTKFLGLKIAQASSFVFNLTSCHLAPSWFSDVVLSVKDFWEKSNLQAYNPPKNTGSLRTLTIRYAFATDEKMVILTVSGHPDFAIGKKELDLFVEAVKGCVNDSSKLSIFLCIQQIQKGEPTQFFEMNLFGSDHIKETLTLPLKKPIELSFLISPTSFFQPNSKQAQNLYAHAIEMAALDSEDVLFDLYAGTGTLGIAMAQFVKKVVSIELNRYAVFDAKQNAELNGIKNITFHPGDVNKVLEKLIAEKEFVSPDVVVVDPPRAGLEPSAIKTILSLKPKKILYVSCNPVSQARDSEVLIEGGYNLCKMQPVDQFPHTAHIENIALFIR